MLSDVLPELSARVQTHLREMAETDLADQLRRLAIPRQRMGRPADPFRIVAFPAPRPTREERQSLAVVPERNVAVVLETGEVGLHLNLFGLIESVEFTNCPAAYSALSELLGVI